MIGLQQGKDYMFNRGTGCFKNLGTYTYLDFASAAQAKTITLPSVAGEFYSGSVIYPNVGFAGTGITTASIALTSSEGIIHSSFNALNPVNANQYKYQSVWFTGRGTGLTVRLTVNVGHTTNQCTQGSITIWVWAEKLPT